MTIDELRTQFNNPTFKEMIRYTLGDSCYNCGSDKAIEYHHIVPLKLGGTNRISNIVPLCTRCHKAAHRGQHINKYVDHSNSGRPRKKLPDNYKDILHQYIYGEIGKIECQKLLGIGKKHGGHALNNNQAYLDYLDEVGIEKHRNNIDAIRATGKNYNTVAVITYKDGTIEKRYRDGTASTEHMII